MTLDIGLLVFLGKVESMTGTGNNVRIGRGMGRGILDGRGNFPLRGISVDAMVTAEIFVDWEVGV